MLMVKKKVDFILCMLCVNYAFFLLSCTNISKRSRTYRGKNESKHSQLWAVQAYAVVYISKEVKGNESERAIGLITILSQYLIHLCNHTFVRPYMYKLIQIVFVKKGSNYQFFLKKKSYSG